MRARTSANSSGVKRSKISLPRADAPSSASAKLKINVYHALTVSAEMVRSEDGKRLMFGGESQIKGSETKGVRMAPYAEWFTNADFLVEQYRLVARLLTAWALAGL
jgi:hypothetical protein